MLNKCSFKNRTELTEICFLSFASICFLFSQIKLSYLSLPVCECSLSCLCESLSVPLFPVQFSTSLSLTAPMEAPLQAQYGAPLEPLGFSLAQPTNPHMNHQSSQSLNADHDFHHGSQFSPNGTTMSDSAGSSTTISSSTCLAEGEEEECLVDSQPICFNENPFLVANRKGKGRPAGEQILSGPPVGYGRQGQLQPWLFSKASRLPECGLEAAWCVNAQCVSLTCGTEMDLTLCRDLKNFYAEFDSKQCLLVKTLHLWKTVKLRNLLTALLVAGCVKIFIWHVTNDLLLQVRDFNLGPKESGRYVLDSVNLEIPALWLFRSGSTACRVAVRYTSV